jgi:hypothetical protein
MVEQAELPQKALAVEETVEVNCGGTTVKLSDNEVGAAVTEMTGALGVAGDLVEYLKTGEPGRAPVEKSDPEMAQYTWSHRLALGGMPVIVAVRIDPVQTGTMFWDTGAVPT